MMRDNIVLWYDMLWYVMTYEVLSFDVTWYVMIFSAMKKNPSIPIRLLYDGAFNPRQLGFRQAFHLKIELVWIDLHRNDAT